VDLFTLFKITHSMKKSLLSVLGASTLVMFMSACGPKTETVKTDGAQDAAKVDSTAKEYIVSTDETVLEWKATKKVGGGHNGQIKVNGGMLNIAANELKAGKFEVDMNSIAVSDVTDPQKNAKLVGHLKADDFFSVEKFATSTFEITAVEKGSTADSAKVQGNLTIKDITKNITIPAKVSIDSAKADVWATFSIDRTEWKIEYKSGKIFPKLGDEAINDAIEFKLTLKATKK
jgi:polyisoprenoid-binding protein YceI